MTGRLSGKVAAVCACLVLLVQGGAAQGEARTRARTLFDQAVVAAEAGDVAGALVGFEESHRVFPLPGTLTNLALSLEAAGELARAHRAWSELLRDYGSIISLNAREVAQARVAAVTTHVGRLLVTCHPETAAIIIGQEIVERQEAAQGWAVTPGSHLVQCRLDGEDGIRPAQTVVDVGPGEQIAARLVLTPPAPTPPPMEALAAANALAGQEGAASASDVPERDDPMGTTLHSEDSNPQDDPRGFWRGPWPWVLGAVIVVGIAAGTAGAVLSTNALPEEDLRIRFE